MHFAVSRESVARCVTCASQQYCQCGSKRLSRGRQGLQTDHLTALGTCVRNSPQVGVGAPPERSQGQDRGWCVFITQLILHMETDMCVQQSLIRQPTQRHEWNSVIPVV